MDERIIAAVQFEITVWFFLLV